MRMGTNDDSLRTQETHFGERTCWLSFRRPIGAERAEGNDDGVDAQTEPDTGASRCCTVTDMRKQARPDITLNV